MAIAKWLLAIARQLVQGRRAATQIVAASMTTAIVSTSASAQSGSAPPRPAGVAEKDTVRRYGEKFVLSSRDSVIVRADTTWYPRKADAVIPGPKTQTPRAGAAKPRADTATKADPPIRPAPVRASGGGHGSHASHASHASHRSMLGIRSGR